MNKNKNYFKLFYIFMCLCLKPTSSSSTTKKFEFISTLSCDLDFTFFSIFDESFKCLDGKRKINPQKICDGIFDCEDLSDECLCRIGGEKMIENPICDQIILPQIKGSNKDLFPKLSNSNCSVGQIVCQNSSLCLAPHQICNGIDDCPLRNDELYCPYEVTCSESLEVATACDRKIECEDFSDECGRGCWNEEDFCKHLTSSKDFICSENRSLKSSQICDGAIDCNLTAKDELYCSNISHFYCNSHKTNKSCGSNKLFTSVENRYDLKISCSLGEDECPPGIHGASNNIIKTNFSIIVKWVMGCIALIGNTAVIVSTARVLFEDRYIEKLGRQAKCNRMLVLNLAVADFLMGVYLVSHSIMNEVYKSQFCEYKQVWLTSNFCTFLGIISLLSSEESIFTIAVMTSYRLYGTLWPFHAEESRLINHVAVFITSTWIMSLLLAMIPQMKITNEVFNLFYWLPMPFWRTDRLNRIQLEIFVVKLAAVQPNRSLPTEISWKSMIEYVEATKNLHPLHKYWKTNLNPIRIYNQRPTCQLFFFPKKDVSGHQLTYFIIFFNSIVVVSIAIAYIKIYLASSRPSLRKSVRRRTPQWRSDNRKMKRRILLIGLHLNHVTPFINLIFLVSTDICCWVPICICAIINISGYSLPNVVYSYLVSLLLPMNSALNPIVYSNWLHRLVEFYRKSRSNSFIDDEDLSGSRNPRFADNPALIMSPIVQPKIYPEVSEESFITRPTRSRRIKYSKSRIPKSLLHPAGFWDYSNDSESESTHSSEHINKLFTED